MKQNTKKWVMAGLFAALTTIGTMIIQVPTPTKGYIHVGDTLVYLGGILLGPVYGALAAALGSLLADVFSSYVIYAVPTFVIKGLDALLVGLVYRRLSRGQENWLVKGIFFSIAVLVGSAVMVGGYYLFEAYLYGATAALVGIPMNLVQGIGGGVLALPILLALEKGGFTHDRLMK